MLWKSSAIETCHMDLWYLCYTAIVRAMGLWLLKIYVHGGGTKLLQSCQGKHKRVQGSPSHHEAPKQFAFKLAICVAMLQSPLKLWHLSATTPVQIPWKAGVTQTLNKAEQILSLSMYWILWEHNGNLLVMQERPDQAGKLSPCVIWAELVSGRCQTIRGQVTTTKAFLTSVNIYQGMETIYNVFRTVVQVSSFLYSPIWFCSFYFQSEPYLPGRLL